MAERDGAESIITAARHLFGVLQERLQFSSFSAGDFVKDRAAPEATRLASFALRRWQEGEIDSDAAFRELGALADVVRRAKGPILTEEAFSEEFIKAKRHQ